MRKYIITICIFIILVAVYLNVSNRRTNNVVSDVFKSTVLPKAEPTPTISLPEPPQTYIIPQETQVFQSFNNCGPASLSMLLSYFNISVSQETLGQQLRPYQNAIGDNDDKSVTLPELAAEAEEYGFISYHRPNGNIDIAKHFISNDIPFIVRTWLNPNEDIGHYRVVRGYDDVTQVLIQDDSYQGGNLRYSYSDFNEMWQPFNYEYLVIVSPENEELVTRILEEDVEWNAAWENALERAKVEEQQNTTNPYPIFNQSVAQYHLGNYQESIQTYESVMNRLPDRMLWYQIEPIQSYLEVGNYEKVFSITSQILNNHNRGFSELYILRGKAYEEQGEVEPAKSEYQRAVFYNQSLETAQEAVSNLDRNTTQ